MKRLLIRFSTIQSSFDSYRRITFRKTPNPRCLNSFSSFLAISDFLFTISFRPHRTKKSGGQSDNSKRNSSKSKTVMRMTPRRNRKITKLRQPNFCSIRLITYEEGSIIFSKHFPVSPSYSSFCSCSSHQTVFEFSSRLFESLDEFVYLVQLREAGSFYHAFLRKLPTEKCV